MHVFEVLSTVFPKQSNLMIKDILCNHCDVFLPGRCFSAHNAFFTCNRYEFRSGIFKNLLNFSVAEYPCNDYWFFPLWFLQQTIMVFLVTVTVPFPKVYITNVSSSHQRTWHCVLGLTVMVDSNGPVTTAGFAYNTYRFCL